MRTFVNFLLEVFIKVLTWCDASISCLNNVFFLFFIVTRDHIGYRYEILEVIGKGSFGQVIRATDHKTQSQVAIKIIRNKKRFHAQALVEVKILEHLRKRDHDNTVIRMYSSFYFRNHLCIVFELMSLNLYELIRRNHYQGFSTGLIRKFAVSLLKCLSLLKRENIIHCDLKPVSNQLVQSACNIYASNFSCLVAWLDQLFF